jgi:hypothetical protein
MALEDIGADELDYVLSAEGRGRCGLVLVQSRFLVPVHAAGELADWVLEGVRVAAGVVE